MSTKSEIGIEGEGLAAKFLENKDYHIVARNYRYKRSEVDLIAKKGGVLVFIEVKTRTTVGFGNPEEMVSTNQIKKIRR